MRWGIPTLISTHRYEDARKEIDNSTIEDYTLAKWYSMLLVQEHGDFDRWVEGVRKAQREFGATSDYDGLLEALIASRDYAAVEELTNAMPEEKVISKSYEGELSDKVWSQIIIYWLLQRNDRLTPILHEARTHLEKTRDADGDFRHYLTNLSMAHVTAAEGDREETELLIRRLRRGNRGDYTAQVSIQGDVCRLLGMVGSTTLAVDCLRTGLAEPSYVTPFIDPFLPYFDSIRDEPEFVEMLAESESR